MMRSLKIISTISKYLLFYKFNKYCKISLGKRIKKTCEELGVTFIKFGQILSTRYDLLSEKDCLELQTLLDNVKEMKYKKVREIFYHDFQKYPEELFLEFNIKPIASASVSQVYKAKLHTGEEVAIKVKKPYIGKQIEKDIKIFKRIVNILNIIPLARIINLKDMVNELEVWLKQDIDFKKEIKNMILTKKYYNFCDNKQFSKKAKLGIFISPFEEFCSRNIITMDFVQGIPLNKISENMTEEYNVEQSIQTFVIATVRALINNKSDYYFQADPHPANIIIQKNGNVAMIDYGSMHIIKRENTEKIKQILLSIYSANLNEVFEISCTLSTINKKYLKSLKEDLKKYLTMTPNASLGYWFTEYAKILIKNKIQIPQFIITFGRCQVILDGIFNKYILEKTTISMLKEEFKKAMLNEIVNNIKNIKYEPLLYNISEKIKESPEKVNNLINQFYENPIKLLHALKVLIKL